MTEHAENQPLVAIVIPVYNGGDFLEETLASVNAQTYRNLVICFSDNASTDATLQIIARAKVEGPFPVKLVTHDELIPQAANWNAALALVPDDAKYFRLLCADDLIAPTAIEKMVALMEAEPSIGVTGSYCLNYGDRVDNTGLDPARERFSGAEAVRPFVLRTFDPIPPSHIMVRSTLKDFRAPNGFYDESRQVSHICTDVSIDLLQHCDFGMIHEPLGYVRIHEASVTQSVSGPAKREIADWLTFIDRYGKTFFNEKELADVRRRHLSHYYRRLLIWRLKGVPAKTLQVHIDGLKAKGYAPGLKGYALAVWDWALKRKPGPDAPPHPDVEILPRVELHPFSA